MWDRKSKASEMLRMTELKNPNGKKPYTLRRMLMKGEGGGGEVQKLKLNVKVRTCEDKRA
jgi:hypothetical protein